LIPIISDRQLVDPEFGTGVVKVTPAHDFNDFQCGKTHGLPIVDVFEKDGTISSQFAELGLAGMDRYNARTHIRQRLVDAGLYRGQQSHRMRIALCSRSGDIVEPIIQPQWYLKCTDMAANVLRLTETGQLIIRPSAFQNQWIRWLNP
jgi:valyl-tRNA synthetase